MPEVYKRKAENRPSGLLEQLAALQAVGFRDVDCYLKNGISALFGGTKLWESGSRGSPAADGE